MNEPIALITTRLNTSFLGLESLVGQSLADKSVLAHTVGRVAQIQNIRKIVLLHDAKHDPTPLLGGCDFAVQVCPFACDLSLPTSLMSRIAASRKWALAAWRGGLGGTTCYDELLPAEPMHTAMKQHEADSALLIGADWPLVDPDYCQRVLELHLAQPDDMQMTFTQAPPGIAGIAIGRKLVGQVADNQVHFGHLLAYNPMKPQADPIGKDPCVQISAQVRSCARRFIYDTPASAGLIDAVADKLGPKQLHEANAQTICEVVDRMAQDRTDNGFAHLPQMITLELTPRRRVTGPITPQHNVEFNRPDMPIDTALKIVNQLGVDQDTVLTLGGLGDSLLHPEWHQVVTAARQAGVLGIAVETDLLVEEDELEQLVSLPIDVVSVRLNADTTKGYQKVMDPENLHDDGFAKIIRNMQSLFNLRKDRDKKALVAGSEPSGEKLPWFVPRLIKTNDTIDDMETFFDRWLSYGCHPVIEPATQGCGLAPQLSPVRMDPPGRFACRQISRRMTIHSDGRVAQCDQDWLGRASAGDATYIPLVDLWQKLRTLRQNHNQEQWNEIALCSSCHEWHRP